MGDPIKFLQQLGAFITSYPRGLQYFFYFTMACILISIFLAIFKYPSASTYNKRRTTKPKKGLGGMIEFPFERQLISGVKPPQHVAFSSVYGIDHPQSPT